jgi:hypothetical protein
MLARARPWSRLCPCRVPLPVVCGPPGLGILIQIKAPNGTAAHRLKRPSRTGAHLGARLHVRTSRSSQPAMRPAMQKIWLKSYPHRVPAEVDVDKFASLAEMVGSVCERYGTQSAFSNQDTTLTWDRRSRASRETMRLDWRAPRTTRRRRAPTRSRMRASERS